MAAGIVSYWNGLSGWIKQTGVDNLSTENANDMLLKLRNVNSGVISLGVPVTFDVGPYNIAQNVNADNPNSP